MRRTLIDDSLEKEFQEKGYVQVPFLNPSEIEELKTYYFETKANQGGALGPKDENVNSNTQVTYDFTFIDKNVEYKREVFNKITRSFEERVERYLSDYKPIIANFIHKEENAGEVPLHQNWAFVDEKRCASVSIWCPLVDSNKINGTLEVVPGSHKRFGEVRGPMIRSELLDINQEIIDTCMLPLETKAGDAVILDDSIVHYSSPNQTDGLRLAIQLILIPEEEKSIHYYMNPSKNPNLVEVLEVDHDFYMEFNPWKMPSENIKRLSSFDYKPFSLDLKEFQKGLNGPRFDEEKKNKSWWKELIGL